MKDDRLTHLLDLYLEQNLQADEKRELEQLLKESAEARKTFWRYTSLHALSWEAAKLKWAEDPALAGAQPTEIPEEKTETAQGTRPSAVRWRWPWTWSWGRGLAAGLGTALLFFVLFLTWQQNRTIAVLARAVDVEWEGSVKPVEGAALKSSWLHLQHGAVLLQFKSGARVTFEAPAQIRLDSPDMAFCRLGRFSVQVPERARGFQLHTETFSVIDLGTRFGLDQPLHGPPEVHVFKGAVKVGGRSVKFPDLELHQNQATRWESNTWIHLPASPVGFVTEGDLSLRSLPEVESRRAEWEAASRTLSGDPAALLHYTFQGEASWDRILTNQVSGSLPSSDGTIHGCTWAEGRWPGRKALKFAHPEDRVRLQLSQTFTSVTCLVWIQADRFTNGFVHSLMTGDSEGPGTLRWTVSQQGQIRLGVARQSSMPQANWGVGVSPMVITNERLGNWVMVATAYDGKTVTHYINGQAVGSSSVPSPGALSFGWLELGNWVATPEHPDFKWAATRDRTFFARQFIGQIDEVAVLARVLTPGEIRRYYEAGRPVALPAMAAASAVSN